MRRVEFHQAQIIIQFRIVDDERSYGLQDTKLSILMDTDQEWSLARRNIQQAMAQLTEQVNSIEIEG